MVAVLNGLTWSIKPTPLPESVDGAKTPLDREREIRQRQVKWDIVLNMRRAITMSTFEKNFGEWDTRAYLWTYRTAQTKISVECFLVLKSPVYCNVEYMT